MFGCRPTAANISSASMSKVFPSFSQETIFSPFSFLRTLTALVSVRISKPSSARSFSISRETSASSLTRMRFAISTTVTREPSLANDCPSSIPMAPAPRTINRRGNFLR
jgi:hypothetical protein